MKFRSFSHILEKTLSPSMRREWIEMLNFLKSIAIVMSPSMRREWIEMGSYGEIELVLWVSLHAEGVD